MTSLPQVGVEDAIRADFQKCYGLATRMASMDPTAPGVWVGTVSERLTRLFDDLHSRAEAAEKGRDEAVSERAMYSVAIQEALGNGANEDMWPPGLSSLEAACVAIRRAFSARHELAALSSREARLREALEWYAGGSEDGGDKARAALQEGREE